jgi:hypothetical protein
VRVRRTVVQNRKRERYMYANLKRYDIGGDGCDCGQTCTIAMVESSSGEYVKFADVMESLSKSHNKQSAPCHDCDLNNSDCPTKLNCTFYVAKATDGIPRLSDFIDKRRE